MELIADSTEQIYVRPLPTAAPEVVRNAKLTTAFVPAMSGLGTEEPLYQRPKVDQLLGQAKPGDVLRNLLVEAASSETGLDRAPGVHPAALRLRAGAPRRHGRRTSWPSTASTRAGQLSTSPAREAGSSRC